MEKQEGVVNEVPAALKKLVRCISRGFYTLEHVIVMDMLIRNPCVKEEDLAELLKFERKQLRAVMAQLKNDRFIKVRLRMETGSDGKSTRQNYYYINYKVFVNVVKYKLDHMRRKIETEERDSTSRASFRCSGCTKSFTDLEVDHLMDFSTGEFRCSHCGSPVEEEEGGANRGESRQLLVRFNEQIEPIFTLLRQVEDVKLAPHLLEPEPTDLTAILRKLNPEKAAAAAAAEAQRRADGIWSGDATRRSGFDPNQEVTVTFGADKGNQHAQQEKAAPIWLQKSTILGSAASNALAGMTGAAGGFTNSSLGSTMNFNGSTPQDILETLMAYERPNQKNKLGDNSESDESDNEVEPARVEVNNRHLPLNNSLDDDDDEEMEVPMVTVEGTKVALADVTDALIEKMSPEELEAYVQLSREIYSSIYE